MLKTLRHDLERMGRGCATFARHALDDAPVSGGISLFSTPSHLTCEGTPCAYQLVLVNARPHEILQTVRVDISAEHRAHGADGHYASFQKDFLLPVRQSASISIQFDWRDQARFELGAASLRPDAFHRGACSASGPYVVRASLLDLNGRICEQLTLRQRLAP
jgi:hypothetical protein